MDTLNVDKINLLYIDLHQYDNLQILCLTEIGVKPTLLDSLNINGFALISSFCRPTKKCGGVGIWVRKNLEAKDIDLSNFCKEQGFEVCATSVKINHRVYVVINCYRSPSGNEDIFLNSIIEVLDYLHKPKTYLIVCGDFNFDLYKNKYFKLLCNALSSFNFSPVVMWPTRVTDTSCTLIDQIFINFQNEGTCCVFDNQISDHRSIFLEIKSLMQQQNISNDIKMFKRDFSENNLLNFENMLCNEDWSYLYSFLNFDDAFEYFYDVFLYYFNISFPIRKRYYNNNKKMWVDNDVTSSSIKLKDLFMLKKTYPVLTLSYNRAKKEHIALLATKRKSYYQNRIFNSDNTSKAMWNVVSELTDSKRRCQNVVINKDGNLLENQQLIATEFNNFFIDAPKDLVKRIPQCHSFNLNNDFNVNTMFLNPFTEYELLSLLNSKLKNKKSSGGDDIPVFLIKRVLGIILTPLTFLINLSFHSGKFPQNTKIGKVVPLHKKKDPTLLENYRPVTVPYSFSKIFEYAFLDRLQTFLDKNNILNNQQHGFRVNRSTNTAMYSFYNQIIEYVDSGECPAAIFCDLSRAFDCVNHEKLLLILERYGIRGVTQNWLLSFLQGRKQFVSLAVNSNNEFTEIRSDYINVDMGVPQGSILGPVLFILYVNQVDSAIVNCHYTSYADDFSLIISESNTSMLEMKCGDILGRISRYFNEHDLFFNADKTEVLRIHNPQNKIESINFNVNNVNMTNTHESVRFLGIELDEHLNWKSHCHKIVSKLNSLKFVFINLRSVLEEHQLINLYYAKVDSVLRYGVCFWGNSTSSSDIFIAQKRIIRCIARIASRESCKLFFPKYNILTLPCIYIYEICVYIFINKETFQLNGDSYHYNTRQKNQFRIPFAKLKLTYNSPKYMGLRIFNKLPDSLRYINNIRSFKSNLKKFLIEKHFYSLNEFIANT